MKSLVFSVAVYLFLFSNAFAQEKKITSTLVSKIKIEATTFVNTDPFGYLYYLKNNTLYKQKDSELFQYKNLSLGKITKVDIQNPLKIVLFYEGFNTVVLVDNQFNETQVISFSKNNSTVMASAIGLASQNRLWVFNSLTMQLGFYDYLKLTYTPLAQPFQQPIINYDSNFNTFYYDVKEGKSTLIEIEEKSFESFRFKDQFLTIFTNSEISTYQISLP